MKLSLGMKCCLMMEKEEITLNVKTSTFRQKYKAITIKIRAPKEMFEVTELLSRKEVYPSIDSFLEDEVTRVLNEYASGAEKFLNRAVNEK